MQLCLNTDSVSHLALDQALDLAAGFDGCAIELAVGEGSSLPAQRVLQLLEDRHAMASFRQSLASRGLPIAAVNCSGWALKSAFGEEFAALTDNDRVDHHHADGPPARLEQAHPKP